MSKEVIIVCQNNKGRSIAAKAYIERDLQKHGFGEIIEVKSAGISLGRIEQLRRENHDYTSRTTSHILKEQGINIHNHRITYLEEIINSPDLILTTDLHTLEMVKNIFPKYNSRITLLGDYAECVKYKEIYGPRHPNRGNVSEVEGYRKMLTEIKYASMRASKRIIREAIEGKLGKYL